MRHERPAALETAQRTLAPKIFLPFKNVEYPNSKSWACPCPQGDLAIGSYLRASPRALVFYVSFLKKEKEDKKFTSNKNSIYPILYPRFLSRGCRWASLPNAER